MSVRFTVTTAYLLKDTESKDEDNVRLVLNQVAEKDVRFNLDSEIVFEVCDGDLVMTTKVMTPCIGTVIGTRCFSRYDLDNLTEVSKVQSRRPSFSVTPNLSRRGSYNVRQDEILENFSQILAAKMEKRRLSLPKNISRGPLIEISHHE